MRLSCYHQSRAKASLLEQLPYASFGQVMEGADGDAFTSCRGASAPGHLVEGRPSPCAAAVAPERTKQKDPRPGRDVRITYLFAVSPLPRSRVSSARRCCRGWWPLAQLPSAGNRGLLVVGTAARMGEIDLRVLR